MSYDPAAESRTLVSLNPGRDVQRVGTAKFLGEDVEKIHDPVWAVIGNLGDSQCYLGVTAKVQAVQAALHNRIAADHLGVRLIAPAFTLGVSDGQLNGTPQMRFSLIGRELVHDVADVHLAANGVQGLIAVVACDKPPVGTLAAILENDTPAVILSDGSIHPGIDPETNQPIDLVSAFQMADQPDDVRTRYALHACPGQGSCGGMFTYNTMQTFIGVLGLELGQLGRFAGDHDLAARAMRHTVARAPRIHPLAAGDAQRGLEALRRVVQPGVDHAAVARRRLLAQSAVALEHGDGLAAAREHGGARHADHATADDHGMKLFHADSGSAAR